MDTLLLILIVSVFTGVICLSLGLLITVKRKYDLINGVDLSTLKEPGKFGQFVGNSISLTGLMIMILGVLVYAQLIGIYVYLVGVIVASVFPLPAFFVAKSKYTD